MSSDFYSTEGLPGNLSIRIEGLVKRYLMYDHPSHRLLQMLWRGKRKYFQEVTVLQNISLEVNKGETVGILGRNGAGKSTLLQIIAGILEPSEGTVQVAGRIAPLIELGTGFNPEFTGEENIEVYSMLLGMSSEEVERKHDDIAAFADIGDYLNRPVKTYSSGMYARLAFAVAIHVDPEILIVDEILAVGDAPFQRKCLKRFYEIKEQGCTILLVAHDHYLIRTLCERAIYLNAGKLIKFGSAHEVAMQYSVDMQLQEGDIPLQQSEDQDLEQVNADETTSPTEAGESESKNTGVVLLKNDKGCNGKTNTCEALQPDAEIIPKYTTGKLYEIGNVTLLSVDNHRIDNIETGDTVKLKFSYQALSDNIPPEGVTFVFNLKLADGTYVCGATTKMEGHPPYQAGKSGVVTITFSSLNLLTGKYFWRVAINDQAGILVHAESVGECTFRVFDSFKSDGLIDLDRTWHIDVIE